MGAPASINPNDYAVKPKFYGDENIDVEVEFEVKEDDEEVND